MCIILHIEFDTLKTVKKLYLYKLKKNSENMNNEFQIEQFMKRIDDANSLFSISKEGYLYTTVNPPYKVSSYDLKINFYGNIVQITTECPLSAVSEKEENFRDIRNLFDSLNSIVKSGEFHITREKKTLSFTTFCSMEELYSRENPFDIIFYGIETLNTYMDSILQVLLGRKIFYIKL